MKLSRSFLFNLLIYTFSFCITNKIAIAQVTSDGTANTQVEQSDNVAEITGGERRGGNLFHSFQDFSIPTNNEAFFNNANDISNIFSRVTGGNISTIDGAIRNNGSANLFLINPAGIIFGENARLDIGGSFYGSSASIILFEDGEFSAADLINPSILTINAPIGLGFRDNPGDITNRSTFDDVGLSVDRGQNISLIGGNVNLENGSIVFAPAGTIELGGLLEAGTIAIAEDNISFPQDVVRGNVSVRDSAIVSVLSEVGGSIKVNSANLELTNGSRLISGIGAESSPEDRAGDIVIDATGSVLIDGQGNSDRSTGILGSVAADSVGNAGNIQITTGSLSILNEGILTVFNGGQGNAGNIELTVDSLTLDNNANLFASSAVSGSGGTIAIDASDNISFSNSSGLSVLGAEGGSIAIDAKNLEITTGSNLAAGINTDISNENAQAGDIRIDTTEDVTVDSAGDELTQITNSNLSNGNAGNIEINARNISLINGGVISSFNEGEGSTGDISLNANGDILLDGITPQRGGILNFSNEESAGTVGSISLQGQNLTITNGANVQSLAAGETDSGDININIEDTIRIDGFGNSTLADGTSNIFPSNISSNVADSSVGSSGNINIDTQNLFLSRNGNINASIVGLGNAGNININADLITIGEQGDISLVPSYISSQVFGSGTSVEEVNGGNITIDTNSVFVRDGGTIGVGIGSGFENAVGTGGNITINARDTVSVDGTGLLNDRQVPSEISADIGRGSMGDGGNIQINSPKVFVTNEAFISADILPQASGNGGNIEIDAIALSIDNDSFISTNIFSEANGDGGAIDIQATELSINNDSFISADVFGVGNGGTIDIRVTELSIANNRSYISADVLDEGNGGNLTIDTETLTVRDDAQVTANIFGSGNAGNINITATEINLSGANEVDAFRSGLFAKALVGSGQSGNINITTSELNISNGAAIEVGNFPSFETSTTQPGTGESGTIDINADSIALSNEGRIVATTQSSAGDGTNTNISLQVAEDITLRENALISAEAFELGNGGNLSIDSRFIIAFPSNGNGNDIIANAERGIGGDININATLLGISEDSATQNNNSNDIDASSEFSLNGNITIETPDNNLIQGAIELPQNIIELEQTTAQACQTNIEAGKNSFTIQGKGGIPAAADLPLDSHNILIGEETNPTSSTPPSLETSKGEVQPARGIKVTEVGDIVLTAYRTNNLGQRVPEGKINCGV